MRRHQSLQVILLARPPPPSHPIARESRKVWRTLPSRWDQLSLVNTKFAACPPQRGFNRTKKEGSDHPTCATQQTNSRPGDLVDQSVMMGKRSPTEQTLCVVGLTHRQDASLLRNVAVAPRAAIPMVPVASARKIKFVRSSRTTLLDSLPLFLCEVFYA